LAVEWDRSKKARLGRTGANKNCLEAEPGVVGAAPHVGKEKIMRTRVFLALLLGGLALRLRAEDLKPAPEVRRLEYIHYLDRFNK
jgi:hypothetical protein